MKTESIKASLDHLNLTVKDFEASAKWYERIFDFEVVERGVTEDGKPWGVLRNNDSMLCIYEDKERQTPARDDATFEQFHQIYHFGLKIIDSKKWEQILDSEKLCTFYGSPISYPHSRSWYIKDPTGYMIEVVCWDDDRISFDGISKEKS